MTIVDNEFSNPLGENGPELTIYKYRTTGPTSTEYLQQNIDEMRKYHIIFFPCATAMYTIL